MKSCIRMCLVVVLAVGATGCVFIDGKHVKHDDWQDTQQGNRELISQLEIGTQRSVVVSRLGTPADSEAFSRDGEEVRVLFYRTQRRHSDGETTRDETTPLIFKNNALVGWGNALYADLRS